MSLLTFDELWEKLCAHDESVEVEAKRAKKFGNSILETASAFANEPGRNGGYLLLGVALTSDMSFPKYDIAGVPDPEKLQRELTTKCREMRNVPLRSHITLDQRDGRSVLTCFIEEAQLHQMPVYIKGRGLPAGALRRIGSPDQQCTDGDIQLFCQLRGHQTFGEEAIVDTGIENLGSQAVAEYRRSRAEVHPNAAELSYSGEQPLCSLAATAPRQCRICTTIAGLILFGQLASLRRHFPVTRVECIRAEGREWVPDPERRCQTIEMLGPIMTSAPRIVSQVLDDIPKAFSLADAKLPRRDVPLIPRTVIREAVINALRHRSYRQRQPAPSKAPRSRAPGTEMQRFRNLLSAPGKQAVRTRVGRRYSCKQMAAVDLARAAAEAQLEAPWALPAAYLRAEFEGDEAKAWPICTLGELGNLLPTRSIATEGDTAARAPQ